MSTDQTAARDLAIEDWRVADDAEIVNVHTGEQMVSTFGDRDLAEYIVQAVNAYRVRALAGAPDVTALVAKYRAKSAEYLEDWQDWDSHDGHQRCGQGIAYSDVADELEALLGATTNKPEEG